MKIFSRTKRAVVLSGISLLLLPYLLAAAWAAVSDSPHLDRSKNPGGCSSCHGIQAQKLTAGNASMRYVICFNCHDQSAALRGGTARSNMASVFSKRYRHPVMETGKHHRLSEELPEKNPGLPRHVSCQDCHKIHETTAAKPMAGIKGYTSGKMRVVEARKDYEICYNCHADSNNLPVGSKNKRMEFDRNNLSYHPVESSGKNRRVPSLTGTLNVMSTIECNDCHGNDDPYGPKGPHGSNYPAILRFEYVKSETAEGLKAYELCYACHNRGSVLGDESFKRHKNHVVYNHIPCSACHTPHGTDRNQHLIDFDTKFVSLLPLPSYIPSIDGRPICLLNCHVGGRDIVHNAAFYTSKRWP